MTRVVRGYIILSALVSSSIGAPALAQSPAYAATPGLVGDTLVDVSLAQVIDAASARGLPAAPLLAKVREGRLKRAATPRIRTALTALVSRLDTARAALGPTASADELVAGADAIAAGADGSAVRLVRAAAGSPASAPLGALAQLVASGVPAPRAASMVVELLRKRASPAQVLAFGNLVESDVVSGLPAEESATLRLHSFDARSAETNALSGPTVSDGNLSSRPPTPPQTKTPKRRP